MAETPSPPRRRGRPRSVATRTEVVHLRLTPGELDLAYRRSLRLGRPLAEIVRSMLLRWARQDDHAGPRS